MADTFYSGTIEWDAPGIYDGAFSNVDFVFTAAGTYDFRTAIFIGTMDLINTSGGAVTVKLMPLVSYTNTGPNITVESPAPVANANLIDGTRVQLYNVTQDAELDNSVVSGGAGYTYSVALGPGQEVEVGDTLRLRATYASGTAYKENYEEFAFATASGIAFLEAQVDWAAANGLGLDGSLQTEFSTDFPNIQVDIDASGDVFNVADLVAWLAYIQTTEGGIQNFFGALEGQDAANWVVNTALVDLMLDNVNAATATQADTIILVRDDRVYPQVVPTSGGGGIGMLMGGSVYIVETGVSGLTPGESSKLMAIPTVGDIDTQLSGTHGAGSWEGAAAGDVADAVWAKDLSGAAVAGSAADVVKKGRAAAEGALAVSV